MGRTWFGRTWPTCGVLLLLAGSAATAAGLVTVVQQKRAFSASDLDVGPGDVVRFRNDDGFIHQLYIEAPRLSFESAEQAPGENVDVRFPVSGLFEVRCHIHPKMLIRINVH